MLLFSLWNLRAECQNQIDGYAGAKFKKFATEEDAYAFAEIPMGKSNLIFWFLKIKSYNITDIANLQITLNITFKCDLFHLKFSTHTHTYIKK